MFPIRYYILVNKILILFYRYFSGIWRFINLKLIYFNSFKKIETRIDSIEFKRILQKLLGSFNDFPDDDKFNFDNKDEIIKLADLALKHKFDLLGSGLVELSPITWNCDFKSGYTWANGKFYKDYVLKNKKGGADVKVPWELSRCHHLLWLGQAYQITQNEKYAYEIIHQIDNWIDENKCMYSINWTCSMDVAIRSVNWIYALNMIIDSGCMDDLFSKKTTKSLYEHYLFILWNLEKWFPYSANHYAANVSGLLFLCEFFSEILQNQVVKDFIENEFYTEIRSQILPSGIHFEKSISYHRLVTELFFFTYLLQVRLHRDIPNDIHYRIKSLVDSIYWFTRKDGTVPLIGDNDDGRFLPFIKSDLYNYNYLLKLGKSIFTEINSPYFNIEKYDPYIFYLNRNYYSLCKSLFYENPTDSLRVFTDAGFAIVKNSNFHLIFNNIGLSRYPSKSKDLNSSHTHSDLLSFVFSYNSIPVFIDSGTYVYTSDIKKRNFFRKTMSHNALVFNDLDQYGILDNDIFSLSNYVKVNPIKILDNNSICSSYEFSNKKNETIKHLRELRYDEKKYNFQILDSFVFKGNQTLKWYFHLSPFVSIFEINSKGVILVIDGKRFELVIESDKYYNIISKESLFSPSYGILENNNVLLFELYSNCLTRVIFHFRLVS